MPSCRGQMSDWRRNVAIHPSDNCAGLGSAQETRPESLQADSICEVEGAICVPGAYLGIHEYEIHPRPPSCGGCAFDLQPDGSQESKQGLPPSVTPGTLAEAVAVDAQESSVAFPPTKVAFPLAFPPAPTDAPPEFNSEVPFSPNARGGHQRNRSPSGSFCGESTGNLTIRLPSTIKDNRCQDHSKSNRFSEASTSDQSCQIRDPMQFAGSSRVHFTGGLNSDSGDSSFGHLLGHVHTTDLLEDETFEENYQVVGKLGEGAFGFVQKAIRKCDGSRVAIKSVNSSLLKDRGRSDWYTEVRINRVVTHPNIARFYSGFVVGEWVYLVMEYCSGGDLQQVLAGGCLLKQHRIGQLLWQMISGLAYCHHHRICHRDVKPENYLLDSSKKDAPVKLIDFGLARVFCPGVQMKSVVGTVEYCAPEMLQIGKYTENCDIWSVGVVCYVLCVRKSPFDGDDEVTKVDSVSSGAGRWAALDDQFPAYAPLKRVVFSLLTVNPEVRPSASALVGNETLQDFIEQGPSRSCGCPAFFSSF